MCVEAFASIVWLHSPTAPTATGWIFGSTARIASTTVLCFSTYFSSGMWPICQSPYISLPTAQSFTPNGPRAAVLRALAAERRRRRAVRVLDELRPPTPGPPLPVLTATYGSVPIRRIRSMNSWRPTSLCSTPFQAGFLRGGRRSGSPMPSFQSYPLTKLPPGQR